MATPVNPLDKYVSYTYHFELHASNNYDDIKNIALFDNNVATTRTKSTGTLLINTRKDAHQTIDNVRFQYIGCDGDPTGSMVSYTEVHMNITEAGGAFFVQKMRDHSEKYGCEGSTFGMTFGLKIIFVGRLADNSIETKPVPYLLPLVLVDGSSEFDYRGGEHSLVFVSAANINPSVRYPDNSFARSLVYVNRNLTIKAKTVSEALQQLEDKLNENYKVTYAKEIDNVNNAKNITYKINNLLGIDGPLTTTNVESYVQGDAVSLTFLQTDDITSMIRKIVQASKEVNEVVGKSIDGLKKEFHPNVNIPTFATRYLLKSDELQLIFDVNMYKGGRKEELTYEFDFLHSDPGKNVDVLNFQMKFLTMAAVYASKTDWGSEKNSNLTSTVPSSDPAYHAANSLTPNVSVQNIGADNPAKQASTIPRGSVAILPTVTPQESSGHASTPHTAVAARRLAFEAGSLMAAATGNQMAFSIRGHFNLLGTCFATPDGGAIPFSQTSGLWLKVNIKNDDGTPFYYTGYYQCLAIDNIFSGGKFTQVLSCIMVQK